MFGRPHASRCRIHSIFGPRSTANRCPARDAYGQMEVRSNPPSGDAARRNTEIPGVRPRGLEGPARKSRSGRSSLVVRAGVRERYEAIPEPAHSASRARHRFRSRPMASGQRRRSCQGCADRTSRTSRTSQSGRNFSVAGVRQTRSSKSSRPCLRKPLATPAFDVRNCRKGLIPFHRYDGGIRTSFQRASAGSCRVCTDVRGDVGFTSRSQTLTRRSLNGRWRREQPHLERDLRTRFQVDFSVQSPQRILWRLIPREISSAIGLATSRSDLAVMARCSPTSPAAPATSFW